MRIALVIPAHNEESLIYSTLESAPDVDRIIVINDGSTDNTLEQIRAYQANTSRPITVLDNQNQLGVGATLSRGYTYAVDHNFDIVVVMAGDGQMCATDFPNIVRPILDDQADYAIGNRLAWPKAHRFMPVTRYIGNHLLSFATRLCSGVAVGDSQCGYTAIRTSSLSKIDLTQLWTGYGYPNDLIFRLEAINARIRSVPVKPIYATEQSGIRLHHAILTIPILILRGAFGRLQRRLSNKKRFRFLRSI